MKRLTCLLAVLLPFSVSAAYEFVDEMDDPTNFDNAWKQTNGGDWKLGSIPGLPGDTSAITETNAKGTVLYRFIGDSGVETAPENYRVTATISSGDNDSLGLVFYYKNDDNYYRLTINNDKDKNASKNSIKDYGHSVFLTRRVDGIDTLLAITPWSGTHFWGCLADDPPCAVRPYLTVQLRVQVITRSASKHKYILAQYFNTEIGGYVNLFDGIIKDTEPSIPGGYAGVFSNYMGTFGGRLHRIEVESISSVNDIAKVAAHPIASDPYLLDYRDENGDGSEEVELTLIQHTPAGSGEPVYWYLEEEGGLHDPYGPIAAGVAVPMTVPVGESRVSVANGSGELMASREIWVASQSAFTLAVLPDLHAGQSDHRDLQIEAIMREVSKRDGLGIFPLPEERISASIQVGDMAYAGRDYQLNSVKSALNSFLPYDMPLITTIGNHDYWGCDDDSHRAPLGDRDSRFPDEYIFPVVSSGARIRAGFGVETPDELDNMYFLFDEEDLGGAGSGKWMFLSLQAYPMNRDLFWAEKILRTHSDYNVILVTHQFLSESGVVDEGTVSWPWYLNLFSTCWYEPWIKTSAFTGANSPAEVWDFVKRYDQIKIILDGHTTVEGGLFTKMIERPNASSVLAMTTDISYTHPWQGAGGQFRLLEIDPALSKVRGRLVYSRAHEHLGPAYDDYVLAGQAINAAHSDAYFTKDMDLSCDGCAGVLMFEDFNAGDPNINQGLPGEWKAVDKTAQDSHWRVEMGNYPEKEDWENFPPQSDVNYDTRIIKETDVARRMSKYGRVQQLNWTFDCNDNEFLLGTYLYFDNPLAKKWSGYTFELDLSPGDDDGIGVMFYYTDDENYYRFYMSGSDYGDYCGESTIPWGYWALERVATGKNPKVLASGGKSFKKDQPYKVVVDLSESGKIEIDVFIDIYDSELVTEGNFLHIEAIDPAPLTKGTIGLYSQAMDRLHYWPPQQEFTDLSGAIFDNVLVTKQDEIPPEITCPVDISASNDPGLCVTTIDYTEPVGTDNCPGTTTARTMGLGSGAVFPVGTTSETYASTDLKGQTSSCSFTVTVNDSEVPSVTCPDDIEVEPNSPAGRKVTYLSPTYSDNCSVVLVARTEGLGSGSTFPIGTTADTYQVLDAASNSASCTVSVKVLSPGEVAQNLIVKVEDLVSTGALSERQGDGLITKLTETVEKLNASLPLEAVCKQINAFIKQANAFVKSRKLSEEVGGELVESAFSASKGVGCPM